MDTTISENRAEMVDSGSSPHYFGRLDDERSIQLNSDDIILRAGDGGRVTARRVGDITEALEPAPIVDDAEVADFEPWRLVGALNRRCRFNTLRANNDGVGQFHANNHIGFFRLEGDVDPGAMLDRFFRNFTTIFSRRNMARAVFSRCRHNNRKTVKFTADMPGPDPHDDWVSMEKLSGSFFARTLERRWFETWELVASGASGLVPIVSPVTTWLGPLAVSVNRRHFLAGRRSWTIGHLEERDLYFVETAALERYSHPLFLAAEGPMNIRGQILEIWTRLVENYAQSISARLVNYVPSGYSSRRRVAYRRQSSGSASRILNSPWFSSVASRHPALRRF